MNDLTFTYTVLDADTAKGILNGWEYCLECFIESLRDSLPNGETVSGIVNMSYMMSEFRDALIDHLLHLAEANNPG